MVTQNTLRKDEGQYVFLEKNEKWSNQMPLTGQITEIAPYVRIWDTI